MKKRTIRRGTAFALALFMTIQSAAGQGTWFSFSSQADTVRTGRVDATTLNVRSGPGTSYSSVGKLTNGVSVSITGETTGADGKVWYQIHCTDGGREISGYVLSSYITFPTAYTTDANFENYLSSQGFPESYKAGLRQLHAEYPNWVFKAQHTNLDWNTVISNESVVGRNLVHTDSVSSWKSTADGAYDWDTSTWPGLDSSSYVAASEEIIRYYMDPRNFLDDKYVFQFLVHTYDSASQTADGLRDMVKDTFLAQEAPSGGDSSGPGSGSSSGPGASAGDVSGGPGVSGSSSDSGSSTSGGESAGGETDASGGNSSQGPSSSGGSGVVLQGPMASIEKKDRVLVTTAVSGPGGEIGPGVSGPGAGPGDSGGSSGSGTAPAANYVDILMRAAAQSGVNPFVLASMILQEQGTNGTGRTISGTVSGYQGYYNFFNIEAYSSGSMDAVTRGLWYASQSGSYERPWNSAERSIVGGAVYYGSNYVSVGQDTFYLKKFNVQGDNLYKHQYMTNIQAAASEGARLSEAYTDAMKQTALEFKIPVYTNMPETACAKPSVDGSPNNKLAGLGIDGFALTPTFNRDTASYDLIVNPSVAEVTVNAQPLASSAKVTGTGTVQLSGGINTITVSVTAENGSVREYVIHVVRQENGPVHNSALGSGIDGISPGGSSGGPGVSSGGNSSGGPGVSSSGSSGGPGVSSGETSPGSSGTDSGSSGTSGESQAGPGMTNEGPGTSSSGGTAEAGSGPGGSQVTIIR